MKTKERIEYQIQILKQLHSNLVKEGLDSENIQLYVSSLEGAIQYLEWVIK